MRMIYPLKALIDICTLISLHDKCKKLKMIDSVYYKIYPIHQIRDFIIKNASWSNKYVNSGPMW